VTAVVFNSRGKQQALVDRVSDPAEAPSSGTRQ
jgi:hypothetical protein